jgi:hypothetical protein
MTYCACYHCGHEWIEKKKVLLRCPKCRSYEWNKPCKQGTGKKGWDLSRLSPFRRKNPEHMSPEHMAPFHLVLEHMAKMSHHNKHILEETGAISIIYPQEKKLDRKINLEKKRQEHRITKKEGEIAHIVKGLQLREHRLVERAKQITHAVKTLHLILVWLIGILIIVFIITGTAYIFSNYLGLSSEVKRLAAYVML